MLVIFGGEMSRGVIEDEALSDQGISEGLGARHEVVEIEKSCAVALNLQTYVFGRRQGWV